MKTMIKNVILFITSLFLTIVMLAMFTVASVLLFFHISFLRILFYVIVVLLMSTVTFIAIHENFYDYDD